VLCNPLILCFFIILISVKTLLSKRKFVIMAPLTTAFIASLKASLSPSSLILLPFSTGYESYIERWAITYEKRAVPPLFPLALNHTNTPRVSSSVHRHQQMWPKSFNSALFTAKRSPSAAACTLYIPPPLAGFSFPFPS